jgi:hypothetical protein
MELYSNGDIGEKRYIIRSTFPEKAGDFRKLERHTIQLWYFENVPIRVTFEPNLLKFTKANK